MNAGQMIGVSVVIPCYNAADDIEEAVTSVRQQSRSECIKEIIVVDDGSTDQSRAVIERLSTIDERVKGVFLEENQGPSVARNKGVACATQDYIAFLDADDLWLEDKIEEQAQFLQKHPEVDLICADYFAEIAKGEKRRIKTDHFDYRRDDNLERLFAKGGPIMMSTVILKASCFRDTGGFDSSLPKGQDTDLWLRIAGEYIIHHVDKPLVWKRKREGSVGANVEVKAMYLRQIAEDIIKKYPRLSRFRDKREALIENSLGSYYLRVGKRKKAFYTFYNSILSYPWGVKTYVLLFVSCLPLDINRMSLIMNVLGRVKVRIMGLIK